MMRAFADVERPGGCKNQSHSCENQERVGSEVEKTPAQTRQAGRVGLCGLAAQGMGCFPSRLLPLGIGKQDDYRCRTVADPESIEGEVERFGVNVQKTKYLFYNLLVFNLLQCAIGNSPEF